MHRNRVWSGWQSIVLVVLALAGASSAAAQQTAPSAPGVPSAPSAPTAPGVGGAPPPSQPQQAYPAQPQQAYPTQQQAYPTQQQAYPTQGGYPPAQGYAQPQQAYPQQGYSQQPAYQQPYYQAPYVSAPNPARPRRPSRALLITGASIWGASYLITALVGAILIDEENDSDDFTTCRDCADTGRWLFLPLVGPWIAMKETDDDGGLAFLGMLQLVGAGLTVGGIIRYKNTKRAYEGLASWDFEQNRKLTLDVSSSPLLAGPRMKLQF